VAFSLEFSNDADGIQPFIVDKKSGSNFISSHHAPLTGYQPSVMYRRVNAPGQLSITSYDKNGDYNYYFRIRCDEDDESTCLYGKIYGRVDFSAKGFVKFKYYLNPTPGDTNVEFDPKENLFKNLKNKITTP